MIQYIWYDMIHDIWYGIIYDMIYMLFLLTATGLSPGGSKHLHTNNTQNNTNNNRTTEITTKLEECGPCPVFASFSLAFALQLRKKHGKNISQVKKNLSQSTVHIRITRITKTPTHYKTHARTHTRTHTHYKTIIRQWKEPSSGI